MSNHEKCLFYDPEGESRRVYSFGVLSIIQTNFEAIFEIWSTKLWPNKKTSLLPTSSIAFDGSFDLAQHNQSPVFFALQLKAPDSEALITIGVISGFCTKDLRFRSRGLYISEQFRGHGCGQWLLKTLASYASSQGCLWLWSLPRLSAWKSYETFGFKRVSDWSDKNMDHGPNALAVYDLSNLQKS